MHSLSIYLSSSIDPSDRSFLHSFYHSCIRSLKRKYAFPQHQHSSSPPSPSLQFSSNHPSNHSFIHPSPPLPLPPPLFHDPTSTTPLPPQLSLPLHLLPQYLTQHLHFLEAVEHLCADGPVGAFELDAEAAVGADGAGVVLADGRVVQV